MAEDVTIAELPPLAWASLIACRGCAGQLQERIRARWGAELPATPRVTEGGGVRFIWAGPERWLAASERSGRALVAALRETAARTAAVCDQSDSRLVLSISGPRARDVLAKCVAIDLHASAFAVGDTAITLVGHIGCQIWQADDKPTYILAVPRSYEESVRARLDEAAVEFAKG